MLNIHMYNLEARGNSLTLPKIVSIERGSKQCHISEYLGSYDILVNIAPRPMPLCMSDVIFAMKYLSFAFKKEKKKNNVTLHLFLLQILIGSVYSKKVCDPDNHKSEHHYSKEFKFIL